MPSRNASPRKRPSAQESDPGVTVRHIDCRTVGVCWDMAADERIPDELRELARLRAEGLARRSETEAHIGWDDGGDAWDRYLRRRKELVGRSWPAW